MRLKRWEPFREMDDLLKGFGPMFGRLPTFAPYAEGGYEFMPLADVVEREKEYLIKVDLPEVRKEDVKVLFDAGVLTIKGERKVEKEVKGETVHRTERFYGTFERSFELPDDVDPKAIHAECKDGVLLVSLPRIAVQKPRPLAITIQ
ncbi:MAG: Hsp20/alpha crystallin family protein [Steroidobacteraceae bacterium]